MKTALQVTEGIKYLQNNATVDKEKFDEASGVGIEITPEEAKVEISKYLDSIKTDLESKRYSILPKVLGEVKTQPSLKWAPPNLFKPILDEEFLARLGPKDERDVKKKEKAKTPANAAATKSKILVLNLNVLCFLKGSLGICINQVKNLKCTLNC